MNDRDQTILDAIARHKPNSKGIVRANCPHCENVLGKVDRKSCLSLNVTNGYWKCYRCSSSGKLGELPFDLDTIKLADVDAPVVPINLPSGYVPLFEREGQAALVCKPARKYLAKRGITEETVKSARIGACIRGFFNGRIIVPIYKAGKLAGYVGRAWSKHAERKYLYNEGFSRADTLYNEEALYKTTDVPCLVVEGVFDSFPYYPDVVACLGKPSQAQIEMMAAARRPVVVCLDGDAWREAVALAMGLKLAGVRAAAIHIPPGLDPATVNADLVRGRAKQLIAETYGE